MAIRKNNRKQSSHPRIRASRPINDDSDMAGLEKMLRTLATVPVDDPNPNAVEDAMIRLALGRVLEAVAESGNDNYLMLKAAPALEALSEGPLSDTARDTAHTFLELLCSHLPNPRLAH